MLFLPSHLSFVYQLLTVGDANVGKVKVVSYLQKRTFPKMIPVLGSLPASDRSHKPCHYLLSGPHLSSLPLS